MNREKVARELVKLARELTARNLAKDKADVRNGLRGIITLARQLDDLANDYITEDNAQEALKAMKDVKKAINKLDDIIK